MGGGTEMIGPGPVGIVVLVPAPVAVPAPIAGPGPAAWGAPVLVVVPPVVVVTGAGPVPLPPVPGVGPKGFAPSLRWRLTFRAFLHLARRLAYLALPLDTLDAHFA